MSKNKGWEKVNYAVHPGEILKEYLEDANMTQKELSEKTGIHKTIINEIINGKRSISIPNAFKLEKVFDIEARFWINLQSIYDEVNERLEMEKKNQIKEVWVISYESNNSITPINRITCTTSWNEKNEPLFCQQGAS